MIPHYSDADVAGCVTAREALDAMASAFAELARGDAAMQPRVRTEAGHTKLSTMGAVIPAMGVAGAKVYTTIAGRFSFVVLLFDANDGRLLATFDAAALTELRTAAVTALAARHLARPDARCLAVFGTGVQAGAHARALSQALPLEEVRVVSRGDAGAFVRRIAADTGLRVAQHAPRSALEGAEVIVTATRATRPLFAAVDVPPGCFIAAVGATRPDIAEIDAETIGRCDIVAVESVEQCRAEAGDLLLAEAAGRFAWSRAVPLADLVAGRHPGRTSEQALTMFESVGVGLEDVAIAATAWRALGA